MCLQDQQLGGSTNSSHFFFFFQKYEFWVVDILRKILWEIQKMVKKIYKKWVILNFKL